jgi:hypothetical protein
MNSILDKSGHPIEVGSYVVYGHALGRCAGLRFGKVLKISPRKARWFDDSDSAVTIQVIGVDDDWEREEPKLCSKPGNLMFPNRTIVLRGYDLPPTIKELLDGYGTG